MMPTEATFHGALMKVLLLNLGNFHGAENWDTARFGKRRVGKRALIESAFSRLNKLLRRYGYRITGAPRLPADLDKMMTRHGAGLARTFDLLTDEYSRRALLEVIAYRLLGYQHMKLWTNTPAYWDIRAAADTLPKTGHAISTGALPLFETDLNPIGYPVTLLTHPLVITHQFMMTHYAYEQGNPVWLDQGDHVIDAGAAWGDTALRFAHEVGDQGHIYSFEFEPDNLSILKTNLELNPELATRITVVENALWSESSQKLDFIAKGPGTSVSAASSSRETRVSTVSIDDFAKSVPRIDFIKMDIEGAELSALEGAEQTLRDQRPKLAISIYHSLSDFVDIPAYLSSLDLEYDYYLDHGSIHLEETVLYAAPKNRDQPAVEPTRSAISRP